jgi:hypothetical protein
VIRKFLPLAVIALLAYYTVTDPTGAAAAVRELAGGFAKTADALGTFLGALR